jgi:hypothetical protein
LLTPAPAGIGQRTQRAGKDNERAYPGRTKDEKEAHAATAASFASSIVHNRTSCQSRVFL